MITVESDKASMDIPAPFAGKVEEILVQVGDKVSQDKLIIKMSAADAGSAEPAPAGVRAAGRQGAARHRPPAAGAHTCRRYQEFITLEI